MNSNSENLMKPPVAPSLFVKCRACRSDIAPSDPLFILPSLVSFEICEGFRIPFHFQHCSEECRLATARRENETLDRARPIRIQTVEDARAKYPGALQKKKVANLWK